MKEFIKNVKMYQFEEGMEASAAAEGKVTSEAITLAKEKLAKKKLEDDAREVAIRITRSGEMKLEAERQGRYASKKKNILKKYSESLAEASTSFESSGDYKAFDKKLQEISNEKHECIQKAKEEIFGDEAWRYRD